MMAELSCCPTKKWSPRSCTPLASGTAEPASTAKQRHGVCVYCEGAKRGKLDFCCEVEGGRVEREWRWWAATATARRNYAPPPPPPNPPNPPEAHTLQHANPGPQLSVGDRSHLHRACGRMGRLSKGDLTEGAELQLVQRGLRGLARRLGLEGAKAQLVGRDLQPHVMRAPVLIELRELLPGQHHMQQAHGPRLVARGAQVEPQLP